MPEPEKFALFNNMQTQTAALGVAVDLEKEYIYYLSTAGPSISVKSIWATLCDNNKKNRVYIESWFDVSKSFDSPVGIGVAYADILGSSYKHMACRYKNPNLLLITDKKGLQYPHLLKDKEQRKAIRLEYLPQVLYWFTEYINAYTIVPALPQWSRAIWRAGYEAKAIKSLECYGDCVGAWIIDISFDWLELVQDLIKTNEIIFEYEMIEDEQS